MHDSTVVDRLAWYLGNRLSYLFVMVVGLVFYEVVSRYVFGSPTYWVHEMSIAMCAVAFIFAGGYVLSSRDHIIITVLYEKIPLRVRRPLDVVNALLALGYLVALAYGGAVQAGKSISVWEDTGTASRLPTPVVMKTLLVLGVLVMIAQIIASLAARFRRTP